MLYSDYFIPENCAVSGSKNIVVFDRLGKNCGEIDLGALTPPKRGRRLYSFMLLSDTHVNESATANTAFENALKTYASRDDLVFAIITGDLIVSSEDNDVTLNAFEKYDEIVKNCAGGKPVRVLGGNHESWRNDFKRELFKKCTGNESCCYTFEVGDDLFVMAGLYLLLKKEGIPYQAQNQHVDDLAWLRKTMNENRDRRVFFMQHVPISDNLPEYDIGTIKEYGYLPQSFFRHFKNVTVFHGHYHARFELQVESPKSNYRNDLGFRSVHIAASEGDNVGGVGSGYIVDVYEDGFHLRGMNFNSGDELPIANFWIETKLVNVENEYEYKEV